MSDRFVVQEMEPGRWGVFDSRTQSTDSDTTGFAYVAMNTEDKSNADAYASWLSGHPARWREFYEASAKARGAA